MGKSRIISVSFNRYAISFHGSLNLLGGGGWGWKGEAGRTLYNQASLPSVLKAEKPICRDAKASERVSGAFKSFQYCYRLISLNRLDRRK